MVEFKDSGLRMDSKLREQIRKATEQTHVKQSDFVHLLKLIDQHYDKMEATITQSLSVDTPIDVIFDSVAEALISVSESGEIRVCNRVCARYFGLTKDQLIGSMIEHLLPAAKDQPLAEFLEPFCQNWPIHMSISSRARSMPSVPTAKNSSPN